MESYLKLAIEDYQQGLKLNPQNDYARVSLITLSKASSALALNIEALREVSEQHLPNNYYIKQRYLNRMRPRWGGSFRKMFDFSHAQNCKDFPELAMLFTRAHEYRADYYAENPGSFIDNTSINFYWLNAIRLLIKTIPKIMGDDFQNIIFDNKNNNDDYWVRHGKYFKNKKIWAEYSRAG